MRKFSQIVIVLIEIYVATCMYKLNVFNEYYITMLFVNFIRNMINSDCPIMQESGITDYLCAPLVPNTDF